MAHVTAPKAIPDASASTSKPRSIAGLTSLIYVLCLLAFLLPFASASCDTSGAPSMAPQGGGTRSKADSEVLTGWDLVYGKKPAITETVFLDPYDPSSRGATEARNEVNKALDSFRARIRVSFAAAVVAMLLGLLLVFRPNNGICLVLLIVGGVAALSFLAAATVGAGSDSSSGQATVHHHSGYGIAMALAWFALPMEYWLLRAVRRLKLSSPLAVHKQRADM